MDDRIFAWTLFGLYAVGTAALAWVGMRRTGSMASFAIGDRDMGPGLVGITLAASMASTATFVINPGFVYQYGLSALVAFTLPLFAGMIVGLLLLARRFRTLGDTYGALTLPHWLGQRYQSEGLVTWFSLLTLLNLCYVVLVVVGSAYVMQATLGLGYRASVVAIVIFVFSYTLLGGTYAHAWTNSAQGVLMGIVAVLVCASGIHHVAGGWSELAATLRADDPHLLSLVHPDSPFFSTRFEVLFCAAIMGFALVTQPHLMTKALYLRSAGDVGRFVGVATAAFMLFSLVYAAGFWARLDLPGLVTQDAVMASYLAQAFTPKLAVLVSVAVLAAAMSTLDGILVAMASIVAHDLAPRALPRARRAAMTDDERAAFGLRASRWVIVALGAAALPLALDPPALVGIFGSVGVYGVLAAAVVPLTAGVMLDQVSVRAVQAAAVLGPAIHFALYFAEIWANPAATATVGIGVAALPVVADRAWAALRARSAALPAT